MYIPLYGLFNVWNKRNGLFGKIKLGWTLGEESFCDKNYICRIDNCYAEVESAALCIMKEPFQELKAAMNNDTQFMKELNMLLEVMRRNFFIKKRWRSGLSSTNTETKSQK